MDDIKLMQEFQGAEEVEYYSDYLFIAKRVGILAHEVLQITFEIFHDDECGHLIIAIGTYTGLLFAVLSITFSRNYHVKQLGDIF